jgi:hypothetical protein
MSLSGQIATMKQGYILILIFLADFRREIAEIQGYHGWELLVLRQNAVGEPEIHLHL